MTTSDPIADLDALCAAHEKIDQPEATFRALDAALATEVGHILFTVLLHHPKLRQSERRYTNQPVAYPIGGRKPVTDTPWMDQVIRRGEPYIGRTREDIAANFYDHELIASLGCDSILNMPVRWRGETLGTLNLLHRAGWYNERHIPIVRRLAQFAVPALLFAAQS
jgi:hypothetical protein